MNTKKARAKRGNFSTDVVKGHLRLTVPAKYSPTGKQKRISLSMDDNPANREQAQKIINRIHVYIEMGDYDPEKLDQYIFGKPEKTAKTPQPTPTKEPSLDELWCRYVDQKRKTWAQTTLQTYIRTIGSHINKLTTKRLSDASQIESELSHLSYSVRYKTLTYISDCCDWAVRSKIILDNPFLEILDDLKPPKSEHNPDPFTRKEMERIIEAYKNHPRYRYLAPLVEFLFFTGCRTGEAIALRWKNITDNYIYFCESISFVRGNHIHREGTKTKASRGFPRKDPMLNRLLKQLKPERVNPDDFVFQDPNGGHIKYYKLYHSWYGWNNKRKHFKGIVSKLASKPEEEGGIDHYRCPYSTRHTFITLCLKKMAEENLAGASDVCQFSEYVGNSATMIYEHYLGRSGKVEIVTVNSDSPPPETSADNRPSYNELEARLAVAIRELAEISERLTLAPPPHLPAPVEPASMPELPSSSPSETVPSLKANKKVVSQHKSKTELSSHEFVQLALWDGLTEMTNLDRE